MEIRRAIISGATGAIGTALCRLLVEKKIEVLVLTRPDSQRNHTILRHPLVSVRMCDFDHLDAAENDTGKDWDCFFHLAWAGTTGPGRNDMYLQDHNVKVALDAVKMAKAFGCRKFIGAGSQAEYGRHAEKLSAETPVFPETGYGHAKLCAGLMTRDYAHQLGMEHNWLRILSVFGPCEGERSMISEAMNGFKSGVSPAFTKGEQIWDYVYSKDAAKAFLCTAKNGTDGKVYVLGSGRERPLAEYLKAMRDIVSPGLPLDLGARPYGEDQIMYLAADSSELIKDTNYHPDYTFEDGIREMLGEI